MAAHSAASRDSSARTRPTPRRLGCGNMSDRDGFLRSLNGAPMSTKSAPDTAELEPIPSGSIVVGHDGSVDAQRSLEQAFELAEKLDAPLCVVRTWSIDTTPHGTLVDFGIVASFAQVSEKVCVLLESESKTAAEKHPSVAVSYRAAFGHAAEILLGLSTDARMLVVGSRGLGGFRSLLLGSVSEQCVRHAGCPVLVVRPRKTHN